MILPEESKLHCKACGNVLIKMGREGEYYTYMCPGCDMWDKVEIKEEKR